MGEPNLLDVIRENSQSATDQGARFERLAVAALTKIEDYGFESVWLWHDWPDRVQLGFNGDIGIDIVARHVDNGLWAIQCKFHRGKVPSAGIERFLAVARSCPFDKTMLVSTGMLHTASQEQLDEAGTQIVEVSDVMRWESVLDPTCIKSLTSGPAAGQDFRARRGPTPHISWLCPLKQKALPGDDSLCGGNSYKVFNDLRQSVTTCDVHLRHAGGWLSQRSTDELARRARAAAPPSDEPF